MKSLHFSPSKTVVYLLTAFCSLSLSCTSSELATTAVGALPATALQPYGRTVVNVKQQLELISSAVHFGFSFEGTQCQIYTSLPTREGHSYLQYELDGVYQKRVRVNGNTKEPLVISVAAPGRHTVWMYKATEAHTGPIIIEKVAARKVKALQKPKAPWIEFIGNSITCGAAADPSEVPCGSGQYPDQHNAYMAYGPGWPVLLKPTFC
ncbi:hypothetical protein [Hymenobacter volaticus]|uniref:Carbohydrate esterase 2 N-terminal domain-containing protein n=1 Tax=Hymenobacter volaticus TaxID=2932254 RepID=A0ABY4GCW0_9BACT|nr:hypothetical protein [Hymenobacter volaticus]UOQ68736.1 hypothetical protein MUN86_23785 [Hymenobacter volaticus]